MVGPVLGVIPRSPGAATVSEMTDAKARHAPCEPPPAAATRSSQLHSRQKLFDGCEQSKRCWSSSPGFVEAGTSCCNVEAA